jgi:hypothetical protein
MKNVFFSVEVDAKSALECRIWDEAEQEEEHQN